MSERGVFAVDRGVWDHPMFASRDPFSRREAWMWLISEAAWKPHRRRIAGVVINLARGQVAHSLRNIAFCWHWSVKRVRGFLGALEEDEMITTATDTGLTVITICKYNEYQKVSLPKGTEENTATDTPSHTPSHTARAHEGHNKESKEYKEEKKEHCPVAKATRIKQVYSEEFETAFWQPYPRSPTMSKSETWKAWMKLTAEQRFLACQAIEPYRRFLQSKPNLETVHACRFLSQQRYEGFLNGGVPVPQAVSIRSSLL